MSDYDRPSCDGDGFGPPRRCCNDRGCPCDVEPTECPGCDACDPPCWECGCPESEHRPGDLKCEGCGPDCTGYEAAAEAEGETTEPPLRLADLDDPNPPPAPPWKAPHAER